MKNDPVKRSLIFLGLFGIAVVGISIASNQQSTRIEQTHKAADGAVVSKTLVPSGKPETVATCATNWKTCTDNADLINNGNVKIKMAYACRDTANKQAKYGDPTWPWAFLMFGYFHKGDDYPKTGIVTLIEKDARFKNAFNADVHVTVTCTYDLNTARVNDVNVVDN
jgi:hypothetical protein